jgi:DNA-binding response OmpR family regulator
MNHKRILIVDDCRIVLKALAFRLSRAGFEVAAATDGHQALDMARRQGPNRVIVDVVFSRTSTRAV